MKALRIVALTVLAVWLVGCASSAERQAERERREKLSETNTQLGIGYFQRGQLDVARDDFTKALELDPDNGRAHNMMALLLWRLKDYAAAERHFRQATEATNGGSESWNNFGIFLCDRDRFDEAEQAFKRALADPLYKTPAEANVNAGVCQMRKPAPAAAEKYFRTALEINPKQPRALVELAKLSYNGGRTMSARAFLQRYFEVSEDTPEVLLLATRIEHTLGNRNAEASYAVRLRGKFPDAPETALLRGEKGVPPKGGKTQR